MITSLEEARCGRVSSKPYRLSSRGARPGGTVVFVGDVPIGGQEVIVIGGPCAVEDEMQLLEAATAISRSGGRLLRGGAFKPRTSPYDFRGLGKAGLELLARARQATGLPVVTEVVAERDVEEVASYADVLQIGSRNMSCFSLLEEVARMGKPVLLKRGLQATIREWLLSAEYILAQGNDQVILCERGIRSYDSDFTRNTLDLSAVAVAKQETHLPVIVDPSHAAGRADLIVPLARAAIAVGADGLLVEVHPRPEEALCDGPQSLSLEAFEHMMNEMRPCAELLGRRIAGPQA
ncbi:MAG: 3-deoxy-7-phosphoheptulonate synthase [Chloroflexi bacterium]|nr:3-deoxy-7-phosphoheptulonate synthase [Chloroflexota bacterium]